MQISPIRIIHQISVFAKSFLFLILALFLTAGYAQKATEIKHNEAYTQALKNGDKLLQTKDYLHALNEYERALNLDPSQKYTQEKIAQIEKILTDSQLSNALFESSITSGEKYFAAKDYKNAKTEYLNALRLDAEAQYPKDRLAKINKVFTDPEDEALYSIAVKSGDKAFDKTDYDEAIGFFKQALVIKPGDNALKSRIADAGRLKAELAVKKDAYGKSIVIADNLLEQKKYPEARAEYVKASATLPGESYPVGKIAIIDQKLAAIKAADDAYEAIIEEADKRYIERDFDNARIRYQQALNLRPGERYPKSMLEKAGMGQSEVRTIRERFDDAIANADNLFKTSDMEAALIGYQSAAIIMPNEAYPKTKIAEINKIISDRSNLQDAYSIAIANGDQAFGAAAYPKALSEYKKALALKPNEDYPKTRIAATDAMLLEEKDLQAGFAKAVANADKDFTSRKYQEALTGYQAALALKPAEKYPQEKITQINGIFDNQKSAQDKYDNYIKVADQAFSEQNYTLALTGYQSGLGMRPAETYPKGKIAEINTMLGQQKSLQVSYDKVIASANRNFESKKYNEALTGYQSALTLKPAEKYPQDKLTEINVILDSQKSVQVNYDKYITIADQALQDKNYTLALASYQFGLDLKPSETYPKGKITEINTILGQQKSLQESYEQAIASANKNFESKKYNEALTGYQSALAFKPAETYPQGQISTINKILGEQKTIRDSYDKAIASADKAFEEKRYNDATTGYQAALAIKPDESYPGNKLLAITALLDQQKSLDENFSKTIAEADKALLAKDYTLALSGYQAAVALKPGEAYPLGKITAINTLLGKQKALQDSYDKAIADADKSFGEKKFIQAADGYTTALAIKPNETYPQDKLTEISNIVAKQNALNENYAKAIASADKAYSDKDYLLALTGYQSALDIKPGETYAQEKISAINAIFTRDKEKTEQRYTELIKKADGDFAKQNYSDARSVYQQASALKPAEAYPKDKLTEISNLLLARAKEMKDAYDRIITDADKAYGARIFDQAVDFYENALAAKPDESYPVEMIAKIKKYMAEHSIVNVTKETFILPNNTEKRYSFKPVEAGLRKNNYVVLKARNPGGSKPKVYLNYGRDNAKNGGIVLRSITSDVSNDFIIRISVQDKWYREDNNWLSLYSEGGDIEVSSIQIAQGD